MSKRLMEDGGLHVDEPAIFSNGFTRRKPTAVIDSVERYRWNHLKQRKATTVSALPDLIWDHHCFVPLLIAAAFSSESKENAR